MFINLIIDSYDAIVNRCYSQVKIKSTLRESRTIITILTDSAAVKLFFIHKMRLGVSIAAVTTNVEYNFVSDAETSIVVGKLAPRFKLVS